jgi:hypothetical protein
MAPFPLSTCANERLGYRHLAQAQTVNYFAIGLPDAAAAQCFVAGQDSRFKQLIIKGLCSVEHPDQVARYKPDKIGCLKSENTYRE